MEPLGFTGGIENFSVVAISWHRENQHSLAEETEVNHRRLDTKASSDWTAFCLSAFSPRCEFSLRTILTSRQRDGSQYGENFAVKVTRAFFNLIPQCVLISELNFSCRLYFGDRGARLRKLAMYFERNFFTLFFGKMVPH